MPCGATTGGGSVGARRETEPDANVNAGVDVLGTSRGGACVDAFTSAAPCSSSGTCESLRGCLEGIGGDVTAGRRVGDSVLSGEA